MFVANVQGSSFFGDESRVFNCISEAVKAMLHGAIFLATCNAILLLRDVKLPSTSLHYTPLMFSEHIENSSSKTLTFVHYKHLFCKLNSRIPILKVNILFNLQIN